MYSEGFSHLSGSLVSILLVRVSMQVLLRRERIHLGPITSISRSMGNYQSIGSRPAGYRGNYSGLPGNTHTNVFMYHFAVLKKYTGGT